MRSKILAVAICFFIGSLASAATNDNTKMNERDRSVTEVTADKQSTNRTDVEITRYIRKELMKHDELSTYAKNIKIITVNGKVTLKGPVRTRGERIKVIRHAHNVAGPVNVIDEISIAPLKQ